MPSIHEFDRQYYSLDFGNQSQSTFGKNQNNDSNYVKKIKEWSK
jgi:hypothetical protein